LRDMGDVVRDLQKFDPKAAVGNEKLLEQLRQEILPSVEQLELQLRRQLDAQQAGQVRSGMTDKIPAGYGDAIAEYFRKLSKNGK
jgi:hypothetical protein